MIKRLESVRKTSAKKGFINTNSMKQTRSNTHTKYDSILHNSTILKTAYVDQQLFCINFTFHSFRSQKMITSHT